jgi:ATP-dependent HslUV protease ATP-binding subunit HslU
MAFQINAEVENIGARRLHTVMSKLLSELLFDVPDKIGPNAKIVVTKGMVTEKLAGLIKNKDLSHYIL